jgi:hypothetical protein
MRTLITLFVVATVGCSSIEEHPQFLHKEFNRYHASVVSGSVVTRRYEFFTPEALKGIDITSESDPMELSIGSYIKSERSHYEQTTPNRGCLTVNGYQDNGDPVSLFIEYKSINGTWLMNYTTVHLPQKNLFKGFFEKPLCPDEAQEELMGEFEKQR